MVRGASALAARLSVSPVAIGLTVVAFGTSAPELAVNIVAATSGHTDLSFGNPDWLKLAAAFGWHGYRVERSGDLAATLEKAFNDEGPSLVIVPIDYRENPLLTKRLGEITQPM